MHVVSLLREVSLHLTYLILQLIYGSLVNLYLFIFSLHLPEIQTYLFLAKIEFLLQIKEFFLKELFLDPLFLELQRQLFVLLLDIRVVILFSVLIQCLDICISELLLQEFALGFL